MLFHPACFDLFTRLSRVYVGHVDLEGLFHFANDTIDDWFARPRPFFVKRDEDIRAAAQDQWQCLPGAEYLAANPIFIPAFRRICESAVANDDDADFDPEDNAFPNRERTSPRAPVHDPFQCLPMELVLKILDYLESLDIAILRLSSHRFEKLPISLWRQLLMREMPFVFEVWTPEEDVAPYRGAVPDASCIIPCRESAI